MNRNKQNKLDQTHILHVAGYGVTEDEATTATSGPDETVRAGGVMKHLIRGTGPFPG